MIKGCECILEILLQFVKGVRIEKLITLSCAIYTVIKGSKINQYQLAIDSGKPTKQKSKEQTIRRLLSSFPITQVLYAKIVLYIFQTNNKLDLIIDRTNWKFGKTSINFFVLSFKFHSVSIPLYWIMLDNKGGSSSSNNRISLISWLLDNFKDYTISSLMADREFPATEFISYLMKMNIPFLMRSKGNVNIKTKNTSISMKKLYGYMLQQNYSLFRKKVRKIFGCDLYLSIRKNNNNELVYLISNQFHEDSFLLYAERWKIEVMFSNFKTKGFDLESTKITCLIRLSNLFMLLSLCYCMCCKLGIIKNFLIKIPIKNIKYGDEIRFTPEVTLYKYGFNFLKSLFSASINNSKVAFNQLIRIIINDIDLSSYKYSKISILMRIL